MALLWLQACVCVCVCLGRSVCGRANGPLCCRLLHTVCCVLRDARRLLVLR